MTTHRRAVVLVAIPLTLVVVAVSVVWWVNRPGCFSYTNYLRIENGMELSHVESMLGEVGNETRLQHVPFVPQYAKFPDAPDGWCGVVWGDRCFVWYAPGDRAIYVGFRDGKVVSKYYHELSL